MGESKFYSGELGALEVDSYPGTEPGTTNITIAGYNENNRLVVCLDDTTLAPGDWLIYNEDEATWKQNDVEYSLADTFNGDEFEATEGELITVFELEDEGPVEGGTYYTIVNSGSTYAEI